jgi:hypothetical protein
MGAIGFFTNKPATPPTPGGDHDDSSYDRTFTSVGESPATYNENSKIGSACLKFSGNDQKLTTPASSNFNLGTAFTIDFWMRMSPYDKDQMFTNGGCKIISNYEGGGEVQEQGYEIGINNVGQDGQVTATYWYQTGLGVGAATVTATDSNIHITDGGWHHICFQRNDDGEFNTIRLFVDGVSYASTTSQQSYVNNTVTANPFTIGARATSSGISLPFLYGTIDELEIIDGVAKFATGGFTPPTTANTSTANHLLLMHFDSSNPTPTVWYDTTYYAPAQYWWTSSMSWNGSAWTSFGSTWTAQYNWNEKFRPTKMRITGTVAGGTVTLVTNEFHAPPYSVIGTVAAAPVSTMNTLTYDSDDTADDFKYLQGMTAFSTISKIEFDAHPIVPVAA